MVYSPLYRGYDGDYVLELEKQFGLDQNNISVRLILLYTTDFSFIKDDGKSFNFQNMKHEQEMFHNAFNKSQITDKRMINVSNGNGWFKRFDELVNEAVS
jgi:hypothetical protein